MGLSPAVERMAPAHRGHGHHPHRTRVLPALPMTIIASHACVEETPPGETWVDVGSHPAYVPASPPLPRPRLLRVEDPPSLAAPTWAASASPRLPQGLLCALCKRYAISLPRPGWVRRSGARPHPAAGTACGGGPGGGDARWCPLRCGTVRVVAATVSLVGCGRQACCQRGRACHEGCRGLRAAGEPSSGCLSRVDDTVAFLTQSDAPRRGRQARQAPRTKLPPCAVVPLRQRVRAEALLPGSHGGVYGRGAGSRRISLLVSPDGSATLREDHESIPLNWLRVFRKAEVARCGHGVHQGRQTKAVR